MSDFGFEPPVPGAEAPLEPLAPERMTGAQDTLIAAAREVMAVEDVTYGTREQPFRARGKLLVSAEEALTRLRPRFEAVGHTPHLRREDGVEVIRALPVVFAKGKARVPVIALALLALTILSVFLTGMGQGDNIYVYPHQALWMRLTGDTSGVFPKDLIPTNEEVDNAVVTGLQFMLAMLGILGTHEMGHYLMARRSNVQTSVPFFLPLPYSFLGTMGAVIAMREPAPNRRVQFDIGIAGPLAGLVVAIPVLLLGLSLSPVGHWSEFLKDLPPSIEPGLMQEGQSLLYLALKFVTFGRVLPSGGVDVWIHPIAFAGWAGLFVTMLNLIPIGQLDGGHVVFGLFGEKARVLRRPILALMAAMAIIGTIREVVMSAGDALPRALFAPLHTLAALPLPGWSGWWLWILLITLLVRRHAPVLDEITELDGKRKALGVLMLIIFALIFTPVPIVIISDPAAAMLQALLH